MEGIIRGPTRGLMLLGSLLGANFNINTDQPIPLQIPAGIRYRLNSIIITNPSLSLTTAVGGFYTGAGKTGAQIVPNSQAYSALTNNVANASGTLLAATITNANVAAWDANPIYFSLTTIQGAAATADIHIFGFLLG